MRFIPHPEYHESTFRRWQEFYPIDDPRATPPIPAVYVIYWSGEVVYVGSTVNLASRMKQHAASEWMNGPPDIEVTAKFRGSSRFGDWLMREARLIRRLQPEFNRRGVGFAV